MMRIGGFGYRSDDYGDTFSEAFVMPVTGRRVQLNGIITARSDVDFFEFETMDGELQLDIKVAERGPNLDVLAILYDEVGNVIASNNPIESLDASFHLAISRGTYFMSIEGTGKPDVSELEQTSESIRWGYSDYGSLGTYSISGDLLTLR